MTVQGKVVMTIAARRQRGRAYLVGAIAIAIAGAMVVMSVETACASGVHQGSCAIV